MIAASAFLSKEWLVEKKVYGAEELNLSWKIDVWLLTELSDAPHACGQQGLLNSPLLGLTVGVSRFIWALLVPVQAQTVRQTEDSCTQKEKKSCTVRENAAVKSKQHQDSGFDLGRTFYQKQLVLH